MIIASFISFKYTEYIPDQDKSVASIINKSNIDIWH